MLDELFKTRGPVAQLGQSDRRKVEAHNLLVPGSNPGGPTQTVTGSKANQRELTGFAVGQRRTSRFDD